MYGLKMLPLITNIENVNGKVDSFLLPLLQVYKNYLVYKKILPKEQSKMVEILFIYNFPFISFKGNQTFYRFLSLNFGVFPFGKQNTARRHTLGFSVSPAFNLKSFHRKLFETQCGKEKKIYCQFCNLFLIAILRKELLFKHVISFFFPGISRIYY